MSNKILISVNNAWNLLNFRSGLIEALLTTGYEVVAVANSDENVIEIEALGCRFISLNIENHGTNPLRDFSLLLNYIKLIKIEKPNICLFYTSKPNIYGSLASYYCRVPFINNITGLGAVFIRNGWLKSFVSILYKFALRNSSKVFFQNSDDCEFFKNKKLIKYSVIDLLPGSGVNLNKFFPIKDNNDKNTTFRFLLIARMLKDKGVIEYVNASRKLIKAGNKMECCLLGFLDVQNPEAISNNQMLAWTSEGFVKYLGSSNDVRAFIAESNCIVLPSYREGVPRSLLEAAAMGKPIIATDVAGCREVVIDGFNGSLCEAKNEDHLALKMQEMLLLSNEQRRIMGQNGRLKIEQEFDEKIVINKYLEAIFVALK